MTESRVVYRGINLKTVVYNYIINPRARMRSEGLL